MSSDDSSNGSAPRDRREAVREKAQQVQTRQSRMRLIRRTSLVLGALAVVAIVAVAVTWTVSSAASKPQLQPANVHDDGFVVTAVSGVAGSGTAGVDGSTPTPTPTAVAATPTPDPTATAGSVDIRVYVDYLSAGAKDFQLANAKQLSSWVSQDAATLTYYPVSMLAAKSNGTKYSLRAASAAACVATHSPDAFFAYTTALMEQQPAVDSDGLTDAELADLAQVAGVDDPKTVRACIESEDFASWAKNATDRALQGVPGAEGVTLTTTPMILVNGTPYVGALDDPKEFAQFVLTIASDAYYQTATPTPSASATG